jgi:hypothetical protein
MADQMAERLQILLMGILIGIQFFSPGLCFVAWFSLPYKWQVFKPQAIYYFPVLLWCRHERKWRK